MLDDKPNFAIANYAKGARRQPSLNDLGGSAASPHELNQLISRRIVSGPKDDLLQHELGRKLREVHAVQIAIFMRRFRRSSIA